MLKQRLITALLLIPIFVWLVLALPTAYLAVILGGVVLLAAWEWALLFNWTRGTRRVFLGFMVGALLVCYASATSGVGAIAFAAIATALWIVLTYWLWQRRSSAQQVATGLPWCGGLACRWVLAVFVLCSPFLALLTLHAAPDWGPAYVIFCLSTMWVADSAAYFVGRKLGRRKLAPAISPGKSWEGVAGALGVSVVWAVIAMGWLPAPPGERLGAAFVAATLMMVMLSIVGDLFESQLKRASHVKDSGSLLPGHGGVLDRIDSTTAAAPVLLFLLWMMT